MGNSYISLSDNGANDAQIKSAYAKIRAMNGEVVEASDICYFKGAPYPSPSSVRDIEIGTDGTKNSIIRLNNGGFIAVNGIIDIREALA